MGKDLNTVFNVLAPKPLDSRTQVSAFAGLSTIPVIYNGLKVYVVADDKEYRYYTGTGWVEWTSGGGGGGAGVWGSITGTLSDQTDLQNALDLKFPYIGGTITGAVTVQSTVTATDFLVLGIGPTVENPYPEVVTAPTLATDTGAAGQIAYDTNYFYVCVATNTWKRAALSTW